MRKALLFTATPSHHSECTQPAPRGRISHETPRRRPQSPARLSSNTPSDDPDGKRPSPHRRESSCDAIASAAKCANPSTARRHTSPLPARKSGYGDDCHLKGLSRFWRNHAAVPAYSRPPFVCCSKALRMSAPFTLMSIDTLTLAHTSICVNVFLFLTPATRNMRLFPPGESLAQAKENHLPKAWWCAPRQ